MRWQAGHSNRRIDFETINRAALPRLPQLVRQWLPGGRFEGHEYCARNPHRADWHLGSFKINIRTGRWADFASGDRGGDVVSLYAFLNRLKQGDAARRLGSLLGVMHGR